MKKLTNQSWKIETKGDNEAVLVDFDNHGAMGCLVSITKGKKRIDFNQYESLELKEIFSSTNHIFKKQQ